MKGVARTLGLAADVQDVVLQEYNLLRDWLYTKHKNIAIEVSLYEAKLNDSCAVRSKIEI